MFKPADLQTKEHCSVLATRICRHFGFDKIDIFSPLWRYGYNFKPMLSTACFCKLNLKKDEKVKWRQSGSVSPCGGNELWCRSEFSACMQGCWVKWFCFRDGKSKGVFPNTIGHTGEEMCKETSVRWANLGDEETIEFQEFGLESESNETVIYPLIRRLMIFPEREPADVLSSFFQQNTTE